MLIEPDYSYFSRGRKTNVNVRDHAKYPAESYEIKVKLKHLKHAILF